MVTDLQDNFTAPDKAVACLGRVKEINRATGRIPTGNSRSGCLVGGGGGRSVKPAIADRLKGQGLINDACYRIGESRCPRPIEDYRANRHFSGIGLGLGFGVN